MLFISRQGRELFAQNGIWSKTCYVLPDEHSKSRLKKMNRVFVFAILLLFIAAAILNSWWVFTFGIVALVWVQTRCTKYICRHCETVNEKITLANAIEEYANSRKTHELWITAIAFPMLALYQAWNIFNGSEDIIWDTIALLLFLALSVTSIYAIVLQTRN